MIFSTFKYSVYSFDVPDFDFSSSISIWMRCCRFASWETFSNLLNPRNDFEQRLQIIITQQARSKSVTLRLVSRVLFQVHRLRFQVQLAHVHSPSVHSPFEWTAHKRNHESEANLTKFAIFMSFARHKQLHLFGQNFAAWSMSHPTSIGWGCFRRGHGNRWSSRWIFRQNIFCPLPTRGKIRNTVSRGILHSWKFLKDRQEKSRPWQV